MIYCSADHDGRTAAAPGVNDCSQDGSLLRVAHRPRGGERISCAAGACRSRCVGRRIGDRPGRMSTFIAVR
jgi:hypothetical protein